ncbi:protein FAM210B, mitochondrial [Myripristis murdjan]|uniref:Family with sequence similarity 210 member B n=1 Tax=Myripristis murdjan TaxID=586833 RepID=A0A667XW35_9TELE|nr:protein FAM210B, mitochondrial [Myripristis murdjan]
MLFCRGARLSAAALDQALKTPGLLFQVRGKPSGPGDITWTLRNDYTFQCCRAVCGSAGGADTPLWRHGRRKRDLLADQSWDSSSAFIITDRGHLGRVAAIALSFSKSQRSVDVSRGFGYPVVHAHRHRGRAAVEAAGGVLFSGGGQLICSPTTTMQTRASSTAAATQKRDADAGQTSSDSKKGEEQNLKEPSTSSSSVPKAPRETEPEDGKPNKTQQLKKVFKEYGAVGVSFHVGMSLMSLGMFYLLVSSGIDMAALLCKLGFSEAVVQSKMAAGTSTFVLAYAIHKLFAPVRISITLVSVPLIVRYFRKTGLFKTPSP